MCKSREGHWGREDAFSVQADNMHMRILHECNECDSHFGRLCFLDKLCPQTLCQQFLMHICTLYHDSFIERPPSISVLPVLARIGGLSRINKKKILKMQMLDLERRLHQEFDSYAFHYNE